MNYHSEKPHQRTLFVRMHYKGRESICYQLLFTGIEVLEGSINSMKVPRNINLTKKTYKPLMLHGDSPASWFELSKELLYCTSFSCMLQVAIIIWNAALNSPYSEIASYGFGIVSSVSQHLFWSVS